MNVEVWRARLENIHAIQRFVVDFYESEGLAPFKGSERWQWQFAENPYIPIAKGLAPVWIAVDGSRVVGQIAVQGCNLLLEQREHKGGWIVDVMTMPSYRGRGIAHLLYSAVKRDVPLLLTLTMAPATRRLAQRAGAVTLGSTWQFSRWGHILPNDVRRYMLQRLKYRPFLLKLARNLCDLRAFHWVLATMMNTPLMSHKPCRKDVIGVQVVETQNLGPEIDELWHKAKSGYLALCVRDLKYLHWRFECSPQLKYTKFYAFRDGEIVGYSILRRTLSQELRQGIIVDMFAQRDDLSTYDALVVHAIHYFGSGVASIECATSFHDIARILKRNGFIKSRVLAPTLVCSNEDLRRKIDTLKDHFFFSKGDHDWDQVHLA